MNSITGSSRRWLIFLGLLIVAATTACGSGSAGGTNGTAFEKVSDTDRVLTVEDVEAIGWKRTKQYNVDGLTGAEAAYLGFWAPPGLGSLSYEVRVYPSFQAAVEQGTPFAEEATGEDAVLGADDAKWPEGIRDRRVIVGGASQGSQNPLYGDYAILGNLVILCEGRTPAHSLERCEPFTALIRGGGA